MRGAETAGSGQRWEQDTRTRMAPAAPSPCALGPALPEASCAATHRQPRGREGLTEPAPHLPPCFWRSGLEMAGIGRPSGLPAKGRVVLGERGLGPRLRAWSPAPIRQDPSTLGSPRSQTS